MPPLLLSFTGADALLSQESHLQHGGLFVPLGDPPPEPMPQPEQELVVRVASPYGDAVDIAGRVVQVFAGTGFAITLSDAGSARQLLGPLFDGARAAAGDGAGVDVSWDEAELPELEIELEPNSGAEEEAEGTVYDRIRAMSVRERMNLARNGSRMERSILIKDPNKTVHVFLVQNKRITLDEIRYMAGYRQAGPDALKMIAENRNWMQNSGIVSALVRNPKTPSTVAVRLLEKLPRADLARIAKTGSAPRPVVEAAKRKVIGNK